MSDKREHDPEDDMAKLLDLAAEQEALEMRAAEALSDAPGSQSVEPALRAAWSGTGARVPAPGGAETPAIPGPSVVRRGPRSVVLWGALAVAAAALLFFWLRPRDEQVTPGPRGEYLNSGDARIDVPAERAAKWERVHWSGPLGKYRVTIVDQSNGEVLLPPQRSDGRNEIELPPSAATWTGTIHIKLERGDDDGTWTEVDRRSSILTP